jgi:hypothetical protein
VEENGGGLNKLLLCHFFGSTVKKNIRIATELIVTFGVIVMKQWVNNS